MQSAHLTLLLIMLVTGDAAATPATAHLERATLGARTEMAGESPRSSAPAILDEMSDTRKTFGEAAMSEQPAELVEDRERSASPFLPVRENVALRQKRVQQRFRLKSQMTREQWAAAHAPEVSRN